MATEQQHEAAGVSGPADLPPRGAARRRFTRAGVAASGVLLTLHSQPSMACEICTTPSGYLSGGLQSFRGARPVCAGRSPSYWRTATWPRGMNKQNAFTKVFACNGNVGKTYGSCTQGAMVEGKSWDTHGIGRYLMACHLNVKAGLSTFQTEEMLRRIWAEYQDKGYYTPTAGVRWDCYKIVDYLKGTMY